MQTHQIHEGMKVHSREGANVGKVILCDQASFVIEKGTFFPKDYVARYEYVEEVRGDDDIYLSLSEEDLREGHGAERPEPQRQPTPRPPIDDRRADEIRLANGNGEVTPPSGGPDQRLADGDVEHSGRLAQQAPDTATAGERIASSSARETMDLPLREERISVDKRAEQVGEVRVVKQVVTEARQVTVPVSHEEVRIEQVPVAARVEEVEEGPATAEALAEGEVRIPIHAERAEIRKTPAITEKVRISKETKTEEQTLEGDARREVAQIRKEGQVKERTGPTGEKP